MVIQTKYHAWFIPLGGRECFKITPPTLSMLGSFGNNKCNHKQSTGSTNTQEKIDLKI